MIPELVDTAAKYIGYGFLSLFALVFLAILLSEITSESESGWSADSSPYNDTSVNDIIQEQLDAPERIEEIDYSCSPACSWDWSMGNSITREELFNIKTKLEDAGYFVHPFPRDPNNGILTEDWHWGRKNMGLWTEEPAFYAETEDGEKIEVTPDLSTWEVETRSGMPSTTEEYGYMDEWERENIHGGAGGDGSSSD